MSIPFTNSVYLMQYAFKNPAVEHAKNVDIELKTISFAPVNPLVLFSNIFLIPSATPIEATHA